MRTDQTARPRLDPVRRLRPGRGSLLRLSLVAALLLTAGAALYARDAPSADEVAGPPADRRPSVTDPALPEPATFPPAAGPDTEPARRPVPSGLVGVPVPLADPAPLAVLRPGDRVDLLGVPTTGGTTTTYGAGVEVLALDPAGTALFLAFPEAQAYEVVTAAPTVRFVVIVRAAG